MAWMLCFRILYYIAVSKFMHHAGHIRACKAAPRCQEMDIHADHRRSPRLCPLLEIRVHATVPDPVDLEFET